MTYTAYEMMTANRPTKAIVRGSYEACKAEAERVQADHYAKHQEHKPILVTAEIMAVGT